MTLTLTADSGTLNLSDPNMLSPETISNVLTYNLSDGAEYIFNKETMSESLTMSGVETSSADTKMNTLSTISDSGDTVTVSGLSNSDYNTDYKIKKTHFKRKAGEVDIYSWTITLEKVL